MKILVTGAWNATEEQLQCIRDLGHEVVFQQQEKDDLVCAYEEIEGVICNGLFLSHPIERFTNLRYIQLTSAGYDRVPLGYIKAHNIEIRNARGVYSIPMAEHALAGVLALYRRLRDFCQFQRERRWEKLRDLEELNGKTVLIIGCGSVGMECAKRFSAFGCKVIGVERCNRIVDELFSEFYLWEEHERHLPRADILVLTLPLTDETRHCVDAGSLALLKDNAVVVNISRGAIIDQKTLESELESGRLRAVLDVFEDEPLESASPLWTMRNVIITPHVSFIGEQNSKRSALLFMENLNRSDL